MTCLCSGKKIKSDIVLWANGLTGNTQGMGRENIGLKPNRRGQPSFNGFYQTQVENIYAAGDVIGWPALSAAAFYQGRAASTAIVAPNECDPVEEVATGFCTIPEIRTLGKTEAELTAEKVPHQVGEAFFKNTARAQIIGERVGILKLTFEFDTLELLGIHCFRDQAYEIVHIGQAIMRQSDPANKMRYFRTTALNYPTMAEVYRTAALERPNRVF